MRHAAGQPPERADLLGAAQLLGQVVVVAPRLFRGLTPVLVAHRHEHRRAGAAAGGDELQVERNRRPIAAADGGRERGWTAAAGRLCHRGGVGQHVEQVTSGAVVGRRQAEETRQGRVGRADPPVVFDQGGAVVEMVEEQSPGHVGHAVAGHGGRVVGRGLLGQGEAQPVGGRGFGRETRIEPGDQRARGRVGGQHVGVERRADGNLCVRRQEQGHRRVSGARVRAEAPADLARVEARCGVAEHHGVRRVHHEGGQRRAGVGRHFRPVAVRGGAARQHRPLLVRAAGDEHGTACRGEVSGAPTRRLRTHDGPSAGRPANRRQTHHGTGPHTKPCSPQRFCATGLAISRAGAGQAAVARVSARAQARASAKAVGRRSSGKPSARVSAEDSGHRPCS